MYYYGDKDDSTIRSHEVIYEAGWLLVALGIMTVSIVLCANPTILPLWGWMFMWAVLANSARHFFSALVTFSPFQEWAAWQDKAQENKRRGEFAKSCAEEAGVVFFVTDNEFVAHIPIRDDIIEVLNPCSCGSTDTAVYGECYPGGIPKCYAKCNKCNKTGPECKTMGEASRSWNTIKEN